MTAVRESPAAQKLLRRIFPKLSSETLKQLPAVHVPGGYLKDAIGFIEFNGQYEAVGANFQWPSTALSVIVNVRIIVHEDYQTSPSVTIGGDAGT
jgi:hypothetical protein